MGRFGRTAPSMRSAVPAQDVSDAAQDRAFLAPLAAGLRGSSPQTARQARQRQRLHPHAARSAQRGEEETLPAKDHGLYAAHHLDVVGDGRLERHDASRVDAQQLAGSERALLERAARIHERPAVAREPLENESFATKEADAKALLESDPDGHALGRAQERILLCDQLAADL